MDIEQMRWFRAVARGETVTDTAAAAFITQPAMSRSLARLSKEVGADLFFRSGRGLKLTPAGRVFKPFADDILDSYEKSVRSVSALVTPDTGTVPIAFLHTLGSSFVPQLLSGFRKSNPHVQFALHQDGELGLEQRVLAGTADVIITSDDPVDASIVWHQLLIQPLALSVPSSHRFASRRQVRLGEFANDVFIALGRDYALRTITERLCQEAGFMPRIGFEGEEVETLRGLVAAGLGVALLPRPLTGVPPHIGESPMLSLTDVTAERRIGIAWHANRELRGPSARFRDYVLAEGARAMSP